VYGLLKPGAHNYLNMRFRKKYLGHWHWQ